MIVAHDKRPERVVDLTKLTQRECLLLNQLALEIRVPYNELITRVASQFAESIAWLFSSLTSRHTNLSSTFIRCCQLTLVKTILETEGPLAEVVTDSFAMRTVLRQFFERRGAMTSVRYSLRFSQRLSRLTQSLRSFAYSLSYVGGQYFFSKVMRPKREYNFRQPITLLDCFVLPSSFDQGSEVYKDRYYPGLSVALTEEEKACTFFLPTFVGVKNYRAIFRKIRSDANRFLLRDDFLSLKDYLVAFLGAVQMRRFAGKLRREATEFLGFSLLPLFEEEIRQTCTNIASVVAVLNYRLMQQLRKRDIPVRLVVDWSENQAIDKGLTKGIHDFYPETSVVGYQGFIVSPLYHIYLHPTDFEVSSGVIPDEIAVVGEGLIERTKEFCPRLRVTVAPAFRFDEVWQEPSSDPLSREKYILIALPISRRESLEILCVVAEAMKSDKLKDCDVMVKQHPTYTEDQIVQLYGDSWPTRFRFASGNVHECLDHATLLIGNTSSTCVEALARGVPVIVIGSQSGLTQNPIPSEINEDIWTLCYSAQEVADAIDEYRTRSADKISEHVSLGKDVRQRYFAPVTRESTRQFLRLPI